jgi:hypothetical protein
VVAYHQVGALLRERAREHTKEREGEQVKAIYDVNNNCVDCDNYIYDQHRKSCKFYVDESYLEFIKRIELEGANK